MIKISLQTMTLKFIKPNRYLGSGITGSVYSTEDGCAVKITSSKREATLAEKMIGKRSKYIVRVLKVYKVTGHEIYLIKMERLHKSKLQNVSHKDISKGLNYMARLGYRHWDLHTGNIMYDRTNKRYKLIDLESFIKY
jgi:hypothetical protein